MWTSNLSTLLTLLVINIMVGKGSIIGAAIIIYLQDTKTFPKCYVGRNGKGNQQKLHSSFC